MEVIYGRLVKVKKEERENDEVLMVVEQISGNRKVKREYCEVVLQPE